MSLITLMARRPKMICAVIGIEKSGILVAIILLIMSKLVEIMNIIKIAKKYIF